MTGDEHYHVAEKLLNESADRVHAAALGKPGDIPLQLQEAEIALKGAHVHAMLAVAAATADAGSHGVIYGYGRG